MLNLIATNNKYKIKYKTEKSNIKQTENSKNDKVF